MNIITDVNNLTKTVGDSIKEFFTSVVVNIGTPVAIIACIVGALFCTVKAINAFHSDRGSNDFTLSALPSQFLESSYLRCCGRASQAIFDPIKAAPGFHWGRLYIEVTR